MEEIDEFNGRGFGVGIGENIYRDDENAYVRLKNDISCGCGVYCDQDCEGLKGFIVNPRGATAQIWSRIFSAAIMISLFIDPLFFFSPMVNPDSLCIENEVPLDKTFTILRSLNDIFYWVHIIFQFRTAYVAPSSRVFGRGDLIIDPCKIMQRYLNGPFWFDFLAALPLPQVLVWLLIPKVGGNSEVDLRFIIFLQYLCRLYSMYPLSMRTLNATGVMSETSWLRAAYHILLFYVAAHVSGAWWFLLTIQRQEQCWRSVCQQETQITCMDGFFDCSLPTSTGQSKIAWLTSSNVTTICNPSNNDYQFGIYALGVTTGASSSSFPYKYAYSLWIGLQAVCSTGQSLVTSIYVSENLYSIVVGTVGLLLMVQLIAHMQRYLQSITERLEEWRLQRSDTEEWMHHRHLPLNLKHHVHKYDRYTWLATGGVDEELLLNQLPADLRREIKRHLCLNLVRQVPLFAQLDELTLDAICEKLRSVLYTKGTYFAREGDPVNVICFIIRGQLDSCTTGGGRNGFFNSSRIGEGGFCGEELLTWALDPRADHDSLPSSTRTIKAVSDVEAFCITAEDLKFVSLQFRGLHSRELKHKLRFYSQQWRTWAACYIQAVWHRYKKHKLHKDQDYFSVANNNTSSSSSPPEAHEMMDVFVPRPDAGIEFYAARLISNMRRGRPPSD
ncbi:hypothetical protein Dimus_019569 [Dionaea muscipula]